MPCWSGLLHEIVVSKLCACAGVRVLVSATWKCARADTEKAHVTAANKMGRASIKCGCHFRMTWAIYSNNPGLVVVRVTSGHSGHTPGTLADLAHLPIREDIEARVIYWLQRGHTPFKIVLMIDKDLAKQAGSLLQRVDGEGGEVFATRSGRSSVTIEVCLL